MDIYYLTAYKRKKDIIFVSCYEKQHSEVIDILLDLGYKITAIDEHTFDKANHITASVIRFQTNSTIEKIKEKL